MIRLRVGEVELIIDTPQEAAEVVRVGEGMRSPLQEASSPSPLPRHIAKATVDKAREVSTPSPNGVRMCPCGRETLEGRKQRCRECAREAKNAYMREYMKRPKLDPHPVVPRKDDGERRINRETEEAVAIMRGVK